MHVIRSTELTGMTEGTKVWDVPTRLVHWLMAGLFAFSWWSAENRMMEWHYLSGLSLLGLVAFRLIWGFIGSNTARFGNFINSPAKVIAYARGKSAAYFGHNPLGGYSALVMLLLLTIQVTSGLFATDVDGLESGPLSFLISFDQSRTAAAIHELSFNILLALVALHILAIVFYLVVRKRNLIVPMITGRTPNHDPINAELRSPARWRFVLAATAAATFAWAASKGFGM